MHRGNLTIQLLTKSLLHLSSQETPSAALINLPFVLMLLESTVVQAGLTLVRQHHFEVRTFFHPVCVHAAVHRQFVIHD